MQMSLSDFQALLNGNDSEPSAWSARECSWLVLVASDRAATNAVAADLAQRLRAVIRLRECQPAAPAREWDWRRAGAD